jgi:hypothetical protein
MVLAYVEANIRNITGAERGYMERLRRQERQMRNLYFRSLFCICVSPKRELSGKKLKWILLLCVSKKAAAISCMLIRSSEDAVARCASVFNW